MTILSFLGNILNRSDIRQVSAVDPLPVTLLGGGTAGTPSASVASVQGVPAGTPIAVKSQGGFLGTATVTRAANATPYTANDVVGGALTIANAGPSAGDILLMSLQMILNITALPLAMTSFRLYLYSITPPSAIADNSPFTATTADTAVMLGYIDNIVPAAIGTGTVAVQAQLDQIAKQLRLAASGNLFGYLVTNGAFTPAANSETYALTLNSQQA